MSLSSSFSGSSRPGVPPLEVRLLRNGIVESRHRVHAVVCDQRGRVLLRAGDPQQLSFVRSALKPFQATTFVSSGAAERCGCGERGLAIACASHAGTAAHAREAFKLLWGAEIEADQLQCPVPEGGSSCLEHNCSGKHAAFLATCRQMHWPLESYLQTDHPLQQEGCDRRQHASTTRTPPTRARAPARHIVAASPPLSINVEERHTYVSIQTSTGMMRSRRLIQAFRQGRPGARSTDRSACVCAATLVGSIKMPRALGAPIDQAAIELTL